MSVYVIAGASKGIGFEMVRQLSQDTNNIVVGLVRDKAAVEKKVATELGGRPNLHILYGDLTIYSSLKKAANDTAAIVGDRGVDYLVANGAYISFFDAFDPIGECGNDPEKLDEESSNSFKTNVVGNIHLFNLFMPLILKGRVRKVIAISSGAGDLDFINTSGIEYNAVYAASKAALNIVVAKFSAQYKKDHVLFFSLSPGFVDVGHFSHITPEQQTKLSSFVSKLSAYAPSFKGPIPVDEAVQTLILLWQRASIESGYAGAFVSQHGNKYWL